MVARRGFILGAIVTFVAVSILVPVQFAGASANAGVTSTTIKVGIPYLDLGALASLGVKLNQGNAPHDYDALIANLNKHGGVNGRKVVATVAGVNPASSAQALSVCTQLTEDTQIFVALRLYGELLPRDPWDTHDRRNSEHPAACGIRRQFRRLAATVCVRPLAVVRVLQNGSVQGKGRGRLQRDCRSGRDQGGALHPARAPCEGGPTGRRFRTYERPGRNEPASGHRAQRFQRAGVTEVVAVGSASGTWPGGLYDTQSSFNPPWIATDFGALQGYIGGTTGNTPMYLKSVTSSSPTPDAIQQWQEPAIKNCVRTIRSVYPSDVITPPSATSNSSDHSYIGAIYACQSVALFEKIASCGWKEPDRRQFQPSRLRTAQRHPSWRR